MKRKTIGGKTAPITRVTGEATDPAIRDELIKFQPEYIKTWLTANLEAGREILRNKGLNDHLYDNPDDPRSSDDADIVDAWKLMLWADGLLETLDQNPDAAGIIYRAVLLQQTLGRLKVRGVMSDRGRKPGKASKHSVALVELLRPYAVTSHNSAQIWNDLKNTDEDDLTIDLEIDGRLHSYDFFFRGEKLVQQDLESKEEKTFKQSTIKTYLREIRKGKYLPLA